MTSQTGAARGSLTPGAARSNMIEGSESEETAFQRTGLRGKCRFQGTFGPISQSNAQMGEHMSTKANDEQGEPGDEEFQAALGEFLKYVAEREGIPPQDDVSLQDMLEIFDVQLIPIPVPGVPVTFWPQSFGITQRNPGVTGLNDFAVVALLELPFFGRTIVSLTPSILSEKTALAIMNQLQVANGKHAVPDIGSMGASAMITSVAGNQSPDLTQEVIDNAFGLHKEEDK